MDLPLARSHAKRRLKHYRLDQGAAYIHRLNAFPQELSPVWVASHPLERQFRTSVRVFSIEFIEEVERTNDELIELVERRLMKPG